MISDDALEGVEYPPDIEADGTEEPVILPGEENVPVEESPDEPTPPEP